MRLRSSCVMTVLLAAAIVAALPARGAAQEDKSGALLGTWDVKM